MHLLIVFVVTWYIVRHSFDYCPYCLGRHPTGGNWFVPGYFGVIWAFNRPQNALFSQKIHHEMLDPRRKKTTRFCVFEAANWKKINKKTKINWHSLLDVLYDCTFYNEDMKESKLTNERL